MHLTFDKLLPDLQGAEKQDFFEDDLSNAKDRKPISFFVWKWGIVKVWTLFLGYFSSCPFVHFPKMKFVHFFNFWV